MTFSIYIFTTNSSLNVQSVIFNIIFYINIFFKRTTGQFNDMLILWALTTIIPKMARISILSRVVMRKISPGAAFVRLAQNAG